MLLYNACVGHSTLARMLFRESTGKAPLRCSKTLWFSINDVQEKSLLPNALNGNLQTWVDALRRVDACPAIAPKMQEFFTASTHKVRMFQLELTVLVHVGVEARLFPIVQAGRPKNSFLFGPLFFNITNVFWAKKWVGHACVCPRMVTG